MSKPQYAGMIGVMFLIWSDVLISNKSFIFAAIVGVTGAALIGLALLGCWSKS